MAVARHAKFEKNIKQRVVIIAMQGRDEGIWSFRKREVGSSRSQDGLAGTLPNAPPPLSLQKASGLSRTWQLYSLQKFVDVPATPTYSASDGGVALVTRSDEQVSE